MNDCKFMGRLVKDVKLEFMPSGQQKASFTVVTSKTWKDKQGQKQEKTAFIYCVAWGKQGEIINQYFKKGSPILVSCEYEQYETEKDGKKQYNSNFKVNSFEFPLTNNKKENTNQASENFAESDIPF